VDDPKPQELKMAKLLLETLAGDYDPSELEDDYADAVHALVEAKLAGGEVKQTKEPAPSAGEVVDLLAALQRSVAAAKTARGEDPGDAPAADEEPAAAKPAKRSGKKTAAPSGSKKKKKDVEPPEESTEGAGDAPAAKPARKTTTRKVAARKAS
jgi:DNA end-binding protein Ku